VFVKDLLPALIVDDIRQRERSTCSIERLKIENDAAFNREFDKNGIGPSLVKYIHTNPGKALPNSNSSELVKKSEN